MIQSIKLSQIKKLNSRPRILDGMFAHEELRDDIQDRGLQEPLAVKEIPFKKKWHAWFFNQGYELIDGHRRYECLQELGYTYVNVRIICTAS